MLRETTSQGLCGLVCREIRKVDHGTPCLAGKGKCDRKIDVLRLVMTGFYSRNSRWPIVQDKRGALAISQFKRAAFYNGLKSKVGLAAAKAAALRINLNVQGVVTRRVPLGT